MRRTLSGIWLGRRAYAPILALQERCFERRGVGQLSDTVLFVEHEPVVTLGRGAKPEHVLVSEAALSQAGIDFFRTGRGGDVTVHAPGQLVAYPIVDLNPDRRDVRRYVRDLRETMRELVADYGIDAGAFEPNVGLWVDEMNPSAFPAHPEKPAKIGAIGVKISRWISMHGFALNLFTELDLYRHIVPCGIREHGVCSVQSLTGLKPDLTQAASRALGILAHRLGAEVGPWLDASGTMSSALPQTLWQGAE